MSKRILLRSTLQLWLQFILLSTLGYAAGAQHVALQVELVRAVDAGRVKAGDPVLAKVVVKWPDPQCTLREGAIVKGRIVDQTAHSKTEKTSRLAVLFDSAQCDGPDMKPLPMTVAAVLAVDPNRDKSEYENQPLSDAAGLGIGANSPGPNGISGSTGGIRSLSQAAATVYVSPPVYKGPTAVMPGQVIGIRGVKLDVGGGPEGSSVLSIVGHNLRLEAGSQFVLTRNLNAMTPAAAITASAPAPVSAATAKAADGTGANAVANVASNSASNVAPDAVPDTVPNDETDVCSPPLCSVALAPSEADSRTTAAGVSFSV
jgi:hypothetical protein